MVSNLKNIFNIFLSELKLVLRDKGTILIMVGGVFLYSIFYMIPFSTHVLKEVPIGVIDNDNSSSSREFVRNLDSNEFIKVSDKYSNIIEAKEDYYGNKIQAFVLIPQGFEKDIKSGKHTYITSYEDSSFIIIYKQVASGITQTALETGAKIEIASLMKQGVNKNQAIRVKSPVNFVQNPLFNPAGSYQNYIYPLILILILQQTMLVGVGMLAGTISERMSGTKYRNEKGELLEVKQTNVNEYSNNPIEIVIGKSLAYTSLYLVYSIFYFLVFPLFLVYNSSHNIIVLLLFLVPFLFSTACLGQTIGGICRKREYSMFILVFSSVPLIFLPGFIWPKEAIPTLLIIFSKFMPVTSAIDGLVRINQMGATFMQVQKSFWLLVALCILYFITACYVVRKYTEK